MADALRDQLEQHRHNLQELELQRAKYGIVAPLDLLNSIQDEQLTIELLERRIAQQAKPQRKRRTTNQDNDMETAVLTRMSSQLDKLDGDMANLRDRLTRLESQVAYMNENINRLEIQMSRGAGLPRNVIAAGGVGVLVALILLVFIVWRLV